ncbi:MAG: anhydro-N-acetylmuramic acid kinase [Christensenellaceae bacterium]|nr:anhydro-N-acetylmuramic acid kinase [Christensenellaceae bacterium]
MKYYIGLMSGTSMDGCDAALIACKRDDIKLVHFITYPIPKKLKERALKCCLVEKSNIALACSINFELGHWFANAALELCNEASFDIKKVSAIASHGQTVYHIPFEEGDLTPSTLQLGEPAVIAYKTGVPVVSSMRAMDMVAGGQGAPMVPYSEFLLYRGNEDIALQNLGGIGNVTLLPANCTIDEVFAFDTGPANMIIDGLTRKFFSLPYDENGNLAAKGKVDSYILESWMKLPYINAPPPKSTGRELFGDQFIAEQLSLYPSVDPLDLIATATKFTAASMHRNYELYIFPRAPKLSQIVLSGGGAHNKTLRKMIEELFPSCTIQTQEELGFDSDSKEAIAFALIGKATMEHKPSNVPSVTGAKDFVPLGSITYPPGFSKA